MKILAIIPARSGSKRVPGKNTKILADKPLIAHTIIAAQQSGCCDEIMVSTDCVDIATIAMEYGASVPWLRPVELADDLSDVIHAIIYTLKRYEETGKVFDSVLLLQPTSPFRSAASIKQAVDIHKKKHHSVVSVSVPTIKPAWFKTVDAEGNLLDSKLMINTDNTFPLYQLNGSIYLASVKQILTCHSLYSEFTKALIIENARETIDIDTPLDWALAEKMVESKEVIL